MQQTGMTVSVIICAYTEERWEDLVAAISSVQAQALTPTEMIVVVDHNPQLYRRVCAHFPAVIAVENRFQRGLSGARNSGIAVAQGEIIAFLDDDAMAKADWLDRLCIWLRNPQVMGVGGLVDPLWEKGQPRWFPAEFNWVVGCSYRGLPHKSMPIRNLFGGCMCIRREVFEAVGGFRPGIGRNERRPMGCEETELCIRANQQWPDRLFLYEPLAYAYHRVPAKRGTWHYLRLRCYAEGISKALVTQAVGTKDGLASEWHYTLVTLPLGVLRYLGEALRGDLTGVARAGAIITGLAFTTAGYLVGKVQRRRAQAQPMAETLGVSG